MNALHTISMRFGLMAMAAATLVFAAVPSMAQKGKAASDFKAASAVWKKVQMHLSALDKTIASKKLKTVHVHAFAVRDQVKLLPAKSKGLSAENHSNLDKGVKTVAGLAKELDEAGDNSKQAEAEALNKKFHTVLDAIAGLYPAGALK